MTDEVVEDTFNTKASKVIESVEFRVGTETQLAQLGRDNESLRRWMYVLVALVALNWLHDAGATAEMLDWFDGREGGFFSTEFEHELSVVMPLLLVVIPIFWGRHKDRRAKRQQAGAD